MTLTGSEQASQPQKDHVSDAAKKSVMTPPCADPIAMDPDVRVPALVRPASPWAVSLLTPGSRARVIPVRT